MFKKMFFFISPLLIFTIHGNSMLPKFRPGTKVVVWRYGKIQKGDVVVLQDPRTGRMILKRVKEIRQDEYYVLGDNSYESTDSRNYGWVGKKHIVGKVIYQLR